MNFIERLRAAGQDERLSTGALYLEAASALEEANRLLRKCESFIYARVVGGEQWELRERIRAFLVAQEDK